MLHGVGGDSPLPDCMEKRVPVEVYDGWCEFVFEDIPFAGTAKDVGDEGPAASEFRLRVLADRDGGETSSIGMAASDPSL